MALRTAEATSERDRRLREQATILIIGVTTAVAILRMLQGPFIPVLKLEAFGLADTAAYQAINFGVAGRSVSVGAGQVLPIALFGLSWGLRDLFLAAASPVAESLMLSFAGGGALGTGVRRGLIRVAALAGWVSHRHRDAVPDRLSGARLPGLNDTLSRRERFEAKAEEASGTHEVCSTR